jgi:hypothetical protein
MHGIVFNKLPGFRVAKTWADNVCMGTFLPAMSKSWQAEPMVLTIMCATYL